MALPPPCFVTLGKLLNHSELCFPYRKYEDINTSLYHDVIIELNVLIHLRGLKQCYKLVSSYNSEAACVDIGPEPLTGGGAESRKLGLTIAQSSCPWIHPLEATVKPQGPEALTEKQLRQSCGDGLFLSWVPTSSLRSPAQVQNHMHVLNLTALTFHLLTSLELKMRPLSRCGGGCGEGETQTLDCTYYSILPSPTLAGHKFPFSLTTKQYSPSVSQKQADSSQDILCMLWKLLSSWIICYAVIGNEYIWDGTSKSAFLKAPR